MSLAFLDCPTGLAGDMLLAALFDLGLPELAVHGPLEALGLAGRYRIQIEEGRSGGLRGRRLGVESLEVEPPHRPWGPLRQRLREAPLEPDLRQRVLAVFGLLAEAEAAVHGHAPEQVHFHEVGALDALVDIVGVCAGLRHFGVERLICGVPPAGHGRVSTAHGTLPLPAPAVLEIARCRAIPLGASDGFPPGELTTPTGLALAACWAERFGSPPAFVPQAVGVGLGSRQLDRPNLLRLVLGHPLPSQGSEDPAAAGDPGEWSEPLLLQQAQIDDATAEDLAFLAEALRQVWWRHGTSLGVREQRQQRWILPRDSVTVSTPLGPVRLKRAPLPGGGERRKAEHADLVALAREHNLSLQQVRDLVEQSRMEPP